MAKLYFKYGAVGSGKTAQMRCSRIGVETMVRVSCERHPRV